MQNLAFLMNWHHLHCNWKVAFYMMWIFFELFRIIGTVIDCLNRSVDEIWLFTEFQWWNFFSKCLQTSKHDNVKL